MSEPFPRVGDVDAVALYKKPGADQVLGVLGDPTRSVQVPAPGLVWAFYRNEYAALQQVAKAKGDISAEPQLTRNPRFTNNPGIVEKALAIYNGTYP